MKPFQVGEFEVWSVIEREGPLRPPAVMFPTSDPGRARELLLEMPSTVWSPSTGVLFNTYQSFVLRSPRQTIVIDTCVGDNKARPPHFNYPKKTWLDGFTCGQVRLEQVDLVINTHLHVDHCGWNTRLVDGRWVPTFPSARYFMGKVEYNFWREQTARGWELPGRIWTDSALPLVTSGCADLVEMDARITPEITLVPAPGHTPGHYCIQLQSKGESAMFVGDLMHHPIQCWEPGWSSCFCVAPEEAAITRRRIFERVADTGTIIVPEHFPYPTAGRISRRGSAYAWDFI